MRQLLAGTTSYITHIFIQDETSTRGEGLAGLDNTNVSITYIRPGQTGDVTPSGINTISPLGTYAGSATAFAFAPVDDATMKGVYELHISNNALAAGADQVTISIQDAADNDAAPTILQIRLTTFDLDSDIVTAIVTAMQTSVGWTEGGNWTLAQTTARIAAGVVGDVKDVTGTATLYDADDGTTVIGTIAIAASPNYRLITIP